MTLVFDPDMPPSTTEEPAELRSELATARAKIANLEIALTSSREIGAAVGILMNQRHISLDEAFAELRTISQHTHRKLRDLAADLVYTGALPAVPAPVPPAAPEPAAPAAPEPAAP